jgi:hypothetical protein
MDEKELERILATLTPEEIEIEDAIERGDFKLLPESEKRKYVGNSITSIQGKPVKTKKSKKIKSKKLNQTL